jgi:hypothetical protein
MLLLKASWKMLFLPSYIDSFPSVVYLLHGGTKSLHGGALLIDAGCSAYKASNHGHNTKTISFIIQR